tara:strand:+ start:2188 stop:2661 length:474 start_codon:yes stop_codon:yes gene_type:complete
MKEQWKYVPGYGTKYQVSNLGQVKGGVRDRILKQSTNASGYKVVGLNKKTRAVHQLVAEAFLGHKRCGMILVINHTNLIKTDNRVENLEIVTARENSNKKHLKSSSRYTGVHRNSNKIKKPWTALIYIGREKRFIGKYATELEAHQAYQKELKKINK